MTADQLVRACRDRVAQHGHSATLFLRFPGDLSDRHSIRLTTTSGPKGRVLGFDGEDGTIVSFDAGQVMAYLTEGGR